MAKVSVFRGLVSAAVVGSVTLFACREAPSDRGFEKQMLGRWLGVSVFNEDGDTIPYGGSPPVLVLQAGGRFEEIRGDQVVAQGAYVLGCDQPWVDELSIEHCVEFLAPSELFHSERYWEVIAHGDVLVLGTLEDDGYSHVFSRIEG